MTDNVRLDPGAGGQLIASDDIAGIQHQRVKIQTGANGTATDVSDTAPMPVRQSRPSNLLYRYLDTNGDGTGAKSATGDYSAGGVPFFIAPPLGQVFEIRKLLAFVSDAAGFTAGEYGNLVTALTAGVLISKRTGPSTVDIDFTDGLAIQDNAGWARIAQTVQLSSWGGGDEFLSCTLDFEASGGAVRLDGDLSERLVVLVNDNLTGLLDHTFQAQGYIV